MIRYIAKTRPAALLFVLILLIAPAIPAQPDPVQITVNSGVDSAGFRIIKNSTSNQPVIHYRHIIEMLLPTNDIPSLKVYADGRVQAHFPEYMKQAGDYEMQLDDGELALLIQSLANNGIMDFNEQDTAAKVIASKKALQAKGQLHAISDAVVSIVEINLDEYQRNSASKKQQDFHKKFSWKNVEHDARRYQHISEITAADMAVSQLRKIMNDAYMTDKER